MNSNYNDDNVMSASMLFEYLVVSFNVITRDTWGGNVTTYIDMWVHSRLGYYFWDKGLNESGFLGTFRVFFVFTK